MSYGSNSFPEIGRAIRKAIREARERGVKDTSYSEWRALWTLRQRCHARAKKDPKCRDPSAARAAEIEYVLERRRHAP